MVLVGGLNPGPPALEASTLPLGYRGVLQQVKSNITKLIGFISDDGFDCSISWHYSVNAAEQPGKLLEVGSFKRWPKRELRGQVCDSGAKDDNGSNEL